MAPAYQHIPESISRMKTLVKLYTHWISRVTRDKHHTSARSIERTIKGNREQNKNLNLSETMYSTIHDF